MPGIGIYDKAKVLGRTKIESADDQWFIGDFCLVTVPKLVLGTGVQVNAGSKLLGRETITLGDYATIGYDCLLMTSTDRPVRAYANDFLPEDVRSIDSRPITIGNHAFIGSKSTLMPGCTIPEGCVIQQGSIINAGDCGTFDPWTIIFRDGTKATRSALLPPTEPRPSQAREHAQIPP